MAMKSLWILGILLEVLSTISGTAGKLLIRLSSLWEKRHPTASIAVFKVGLVFNTVAGPILDTTAYSFAAQSLIAPFGGLDVVWNAVLAPWMLKEKLTGARAGACALIFCGTVLSGVFGPHVDEEYTIEFVEDLLLNFRVLAYFGVLLVVVVFNICVPMRREKGDIWRGAALGVTAGVIAGNMFAAKAAVELAESSFHRGHWDVWTHWAPYTLIALAAFFALSNLVFMTRGLLEFEALFMVTVYEGTMIVANCASAAVVLQELNTLPTWRVVCWTSSVATVCVGMGVICLAEARAGKVKVAEADQTDEKQSSAADEEAAYSQTSPEGEEVVKGDDITLAFPDGELMINCDKDSEENNEQGEAPSKGHRTGRAAAPGAGLLGGGKEACPGEQWAERLEMKHPKGADVEAMSKAEEA